MTSTSARTFVDTNVLVYVYDDSEPEKQRLARECLAREAASTHLVVSTQVLQELYVALTRGRHPIREPAAAEGAVDDAARLEVVQVDLPLLKSAIVRSRTSRVSFWDALVVESARATGCDRLLSEDLNDGQDFDGVRVENPFGG